MCLPEEEVVWYIPQILWSITTLPHHVEVDAISIKPRAAWNYIISPNALTH
jgi:hypothetical protein